MKIDEVIKIGGSLHAEPGAMESVRDWLNTTRSPATTRLLLCGGGPVVEGLRRVDEANPLSAEAAHWAAVRMMDANTRLLADWLPGTEVVESLALVGPGDRGFVCHGWLREAEPNRHGERLRTGWQTTSDSIAARIAAVAGARLTLLKHSLEATYGSPAEAAAAGVVDAEFARHAAGVKDLRLVGVIRPGFPRDIVTASQSGRPGSGDC